MSKTSTQTEIPSVLQRFEYKYHISRDMIRPISDFVKAYCFLDKYSETSPNQFYRINNLYFDTPFYTFLKNRLEKKENRFNMRIRSYGENPEPPYFWEIKCKFGENRKKYRVKLNCDDIEKVFYSLKASEEFGLTGTNAKNMDMFQYLALSYNAEPKILTQYDRMAWISETDEYARVTFDANFKAVEERSFNIRPPKEQMESYDTSNIFGTEAQCILELKGSVANLPLWMVDLVKTFDLKSLAFSKFRYGMRRMILNNKPENIWYNVSNYGEIYD
ncbi:polyphosphate polymerase domain-containing protein [bacterium]|nr:polyphosphate polymerase domain-containing protein [bacterium]